MNRYGATARKSSFHRLHVLALSFFSAAALLGAAIPTLAAVPVVLPAAPTLPTFGSTIYNVTVSNPSINGGTAASTATANNAAAINAYITYCSNNGGGIVQVPSGLFKSGTLTMRSNVNLQLDSGATLQASTAGATLITTSGSGLHDMAITGSGIIDGNASVKTDNNLVSLQHINRLLISGVTIENAGHEHLVPERDTNVTISGISINDHNSIINSLNTTHTYLQNTDGIDYSGSNFLIQNCTIAAGDDDIVAKPGGSVDPTSACNNIVINNCNIYSGHGISIGGGTVNGVSNMIVANCTFNPALGSDPTKNSVTYGLRMKAEDGADTTIAPMDKESGDFGGGIAQPLKNVKFINISMTGVQHSIAIESFYNGGDTFASSGTDSTKYTYGSNPNGTPPTALSSSTPLWQNIAFENVTATSTSSNPSKINGLNISTDLVNIPYANALDGLSFSNVKLTGSGQFQLYYGANIDLSGLTLTGMTQSLFGLTNVTAGGVPLYPGDFNRDGHVTGADLGAMLMAFKDLPTYESSNGLSDAQMEVIFDLNNDFQINNADMQTFLTLLSTGLGSASSVPEPATLVLLGAGGLMLMFCYRRRAFVRKSMVASMMVD